MKNKLLIPLLVAFILSGCVKSKIIDDINVITAVGLDFTDDDQLEVIAVYEDYLSDKTVKDHHIEITTSKHDDILNRLDMKASRTVNLGNTEIILLGRMMASDGIFPLIDSLQRDAHFGKRLFILLADGPVDELLKGTYETKGVADYISRMIRHNMKFRNLPKTNLQIFNSDFFQEGKDAYIPIIKQVSKDSIELDGVGIFKGEKLAYEIPADDMFF